MILEAAILDVISGRKESSKRCLQKLHPSSRAWMDIFLINSSIVSKHPIVFFYWCNGKRWKRIQLAFAACPNIRSGRNYSTIFMIHSLLCSITNWHFKTRNKKSGITHEKSNTAFFDHKPNPSGSSIENSFHRGRPGWR